jgi:hypothetical protein
MRGVFTAELIAAVEQLLRGRLADQLDLIVGTSTGGLIALGLASRRSGPEMLDFHRNHGDEIFSGSWPGRKLLMPKYSRRGLDRLLRQEFGELPTRDSAYEAVSGQTRVFKTEQPPTSTREAINSCGRWPRRPRPHERISLRSSSGRRTRTSTAASGRTNRP